MAKFSKFFNNFIIPGYKPSKKGGFIGYLKQKRTILKHKALPKLGKHETRYLNSILLGMETLPHTIKESNKKRNRVEKWLAVYAM